MDPTLLEQARNTIQKQFQTASTLRGSYLGVALRNEVPGFSALGRLSEVLRTHFSDLVQHDGKHGGDDLWSQAGTQPARASTTSAWQLFTNPRLSGRLFVDTVDGRLISNPTPIAANLLEVPRISDSQNEAMVASFVETLAAVDQVEVKAQLPAPFSFSAWLNLVRPGHQLFGRWMTYRATAIEALLSQALAKLQVPVPVCELALKSLRASRKPIRKSPAVPVLAEAPLTPISTVSGPLVPKVATHEFDARTVAMRAIRTMAIDDVRALKIPLGAILDALRG